MKVNSTRVFLWRSVLFIILLLYSLIVFAQPDYDFRNGTIIAGTANEVGAVYQFNNVKTGVDAQVTIVALTGGLYLSDIDGGGGFVEALQPVINIPGHSSGYAELRIDFFEAGTTTPFLQEEVPATPIDIDGYYYGDGYLYEYDMITLGTGYVNFDGSSPELHVGFAPGWITGTNTSGITYDGIDTAAKTVMFTTVNSHLSSMIIRVGAENQSSNTMQRLRSVYFKKFWYPNTILPVSGVLSFSGTMNAGDAQLKWTIADHDIKTVFLQKGDNANSFQPIVDWAMNNQTGGKIDFTYIDKNQIIGDVFYRLKIISAEGKIQYSNILHFNNTKQSPAALTVYPSIFSSFVTAQIKSIRAQPASFEVFNYAGSLVFRETLRLEAGENNIRINGLDKVSPGQYISVVRTAEGTCSSKIHKSN